VKVKYTELIVFKSGVTSLRTKTFDVVGADAYCDRHVHLYDDLDGEDFWVPEEYIDCGPIDSMGVILHLGKLALERVDYCLSDIKKVG